MRKIDSLEAPRILHPNEALVKVFAVSIDPVDISILSGLGWCERIKKRDNPLILGRDFSGVVVEVGRNVHHINIKDAVWGSIPVLERTGAMAEYVVLPGERVRKKPLKIGHEGAATVPFSGSIAWESLGKCGIYPNAAKGNYSVILCVRSNVKLMLGSSPIHNFNYSIFYRQNRFSH